jgi:EAL domain-containing protein (putative c-di-GMP-specific phosphodiesterase class I)/ActR/RegA family two-component response regulator
VHNKRILILDDDPSVGQTIQWMTESLGFEAEFVTSAEAFFPKLAEWNPDIVTIDLVMPELDGVEIMRMLAERKSRARIVILSGMGTRVLEAAQRSAQEHGLSIAGIVSKPVSREALHALLREESVPDQPLSPVKEAGRGSDFEISRKDLQNALDRHEFVMAYQPKIDCKSGVLSGLEALVRWQHPDKGIVMPDRFISLAEDCGLIDALTAQVFDQSLEWFSKAFLDTNLHLSLNLSAKSLVDIQLADHLATLCRLFQIAPQRIVLELTESSAMVDPILSLDLMTRIRMKGFQLSIDDFGTGYSSMVQLVRLPFSEIKVDKSFVLIEKQTKESLTVIKSIIDLGHSLGLRVTAEGVDDESTLTYLNTLGCDLAQGYFIARPISGEAICSWAKQRRSRMS